MAEAFGSPRKVNLSLPRCDVERRSGVVRAKLALCLTKRTVNADVPDWIEDESVQRGVHTRIACAILDRIGPSPTIRIIRAGLGVPFAAVRAHCTGGAGCLRAVQAHVQTRCTGAVADVNAPHPPGTRRVRRTLTGLPV
eukprot:70043-Rhodomonas_salina.2